MSKKLFFFALPCSRTTQPENAMNYAVSQMDEAQKLLGEFGLTISGFNPGVAAVKDKKEIVFVKSGWEFVKPLLQELVILRQQKKSCNNDK